ncbi:MAG: hypothetical protein KKA79_09450 [Nanoarchaeota archaeon]|nr:hypothetical protein [Nanoarchaeota archaeon]MCG2717267.1 hypothetical protein [Nanoarchaeota archaeon]
MRPLEENKEEGIRVTAEYDRLFDTDIEGIINLLKEEVKSYLEETGHTAKYKRILFDIHSIHTEQSIWMELFIGFIGGLMAHAAGKILDKVFERIKRKKQAIWVRKERIRHIKVKRIQRFDGVVTEVGEEIEIYAKG